MTFAALHKASFEGVLNGPGGVDVVYRKLGADPNLPIRAYADSDEVESDSLDGGRTLQRVTMVRILNSTDLTKGIDVVTPMEDTVAVANQAGVTETLRVFRIMKKTDAWWRLLARR